MSDEAQQQQAQLDPLLVIDELRRRLGERDWEATMLAAEVRQLREERDRLNTSLMDAVAELSARKES